MKRSSVLSNLAMFALLLLCIYGWNAFDENTIIRIAIVLIAALSIFTRYYYRYVQYLFDKLSFIAVDRCKAEEAFSLLKRVEKADIFCRLKPEIFEIKCLLYVDMDDKEEAEAFYSTARNEKKANPERELSLMCSRLFHSYFQNKGKKEFNKEYQELKNLKNKKTELNTGICHMIEAMHSFVNNNYANAGKQLKEIEESSLNNREKSYYHYLCSLAKGKDSSFSGTEKEMAMETGSGIPLLRRLCR